MTETSAWWHHVEELTLTPFQLEANIYFIIEKEKGVFTTIHPYSPKKSHSKQFGEVAL